MTAMIAHWNTHSHDNADVTDQCLGDLFIFANPQQSYGLVWEWSVGNKISRRTGKGENESPLQLTNTYARPTGASLEY